MAKKDYERTDYKKIAKELGIKHLIGKWGVQFNRGLDWKLPRLRFVPLDGWITNTKEVERVIRERGMEL